MRTGCHCELLTDLAPPPLNIMNVPWIQAITSSPPSKAGAGTRRDKSKKSAGGTSRGKSLAATGAPRKSEEECVGGMGRRGGAGRDLSICRTTC